VVVLAALKAEAHEMVGREKPQYGDALTQTAKAVKYGCIWD